MEKYPHQRFAENLVDRIGVLTAQKNAIEAELAAVVGTYDEFNFWCGPGYRSMAHWMGLNAGWSSADAARMVRVGKRMDCIPTLVAAADRGEVSVAMLDLAARISTPENEKEVARMITSLSPAQAARVLKTYREINEAQSDQEKDQPLADNDFHWREWIDSRGRGRIDAALDPATLERLQDARAAFENNTDSPDDTADTNAYGSPARASASEAFRRVADAAIEHAEQDGKRDASGERYTTQITADLATVAAALGLTFNSKQPVGLGRQAFATNRVGRIRQLTDAELSEALCCGSIQLLIEQDGVPLWLGNETRHATRHQRRALKRRCGNACEFPGCTATRFLEPHHVNFHSNGGATSLDNLAMLCWSHHHELHQGIFEIRSFGHQEFVFYDEIGTCLGSNSIHGPTAHRKQLHHHQVNVGSHGSSPPQAQDVDVHRCPSHDPDELMKPECEVANRHLRLVDPTIPRSTWFGDRLTYEGLDILVTSLLNAS